MSGKLPYVGSAGVGGTSGGGDRKPSRAAAPLAGATSAAVAASPSGAGSNNELAALFECPVCYDYVLPPILQCQSGHLVCSSCRSKLTCCPTCRGTLGTCGTGRHVTAGYDRFSVTFILSSPSAGIGLLVNAGALY